MSDRKEIKLSGFGGQGIVLAGYILGKAASLYDGKEAVLLQSYGPESRGGACSADVVIDTQPIDFPKVVSPDVLVTMSQEAYLTHALKRPKKCLLIVDEDLVEPEEADRLVAHPIPATRLAEELGRKIVANMVILGFLTKVSGVVRPESVQKAIEGSVPRGTEALNLRAFQVGYDYPDR
ncbi:MAG: 2-oxoacid:acceptor oxidoreductase family protein [Armatimonadetes bacterium]|nr:2-oxoacid:acceptor oxidoreductase family protein [Armatimonadota bacterium]MDW8122326.1 2-oxoacid:acceptor oxidoreductase family protein [Armatimonadota bacterium]